MTLKRVWEDSAILELQKRLDGVKDVYEFSKIPPAGLPKLSPGALSALLIQKGIRLCKRNHWRAQKNAERIIRDWDRGMPLVELSQNWRLFPLALAHLFREKWRIGRHELHFMIHRAAHAEYTPKNRVERELRDACMTDYIHAPRAVEYMVHKGRTGEALCNDWLKRLKIKFLTEREQLTPRDGNPKEGVKTPDFLFAKKETLPRLPGEFYWLESKATFGTFQECKHDHSSQIKHYLKLFGRGAIIYWLGCSRDGKEVLERAGGRVLAPWDLLDEHNTKKIGAFLQEGLPH